jgi:hypothetical protein
VSRLFVHAIAITGLVAAAACRAQNGESWARDTLGPEGAEKIREEAVALTGRGAASESVVGVPLKDGAPYLRRPYVVLSAELPEQPTARHSVLVYHAMNRRVATAITTSADVRGVVLLERNIQNTGRGRHRESHAEFDLLLVDRDAKTVMRTHAPSADALEALLTSLPSSSP